MIKTCLIANRGEIACRIMKTAKRLNIRCIAIYSCIDKNALHVQMADEAFCVGGASSHDSYLNQDKILTIAKDNHADAIHPGYGFLSENAKFATRCEKADIIFIGPRANTIEKMGSKSSAKKIMEKAGVPCIPGYHGDLQSDNTLLNAAKKIGFPVLIKASLGGGGKGMRVVYNEKDFSDALQSARREAKQSVNDDHIILEKYFENPRHIEVQIAADTCGNIVHLFDRDCSLQRRQQKIIEEAPAPFLSNDIKQQLTQAAIKAAKAVNYCNLGTIEFLVSDDTVCFMEMNTRLQVEHPVTEMITKIDLVQWQFQIANGDPLPLQQTEIQSQGHAIEARIYAEDPENQFLPSTGCIDYLRTPMLNKQLRLDSGIQQGDQVTVYYDPLLAKLIAWGNTRSDAINTLNQGLKEYHLSGLNTNINFLTSLLDNPHFQEKALSTQFIHDHINALIAKIPAVSFMPFVFAELLQYKKTDSRHFANAKFRNDASQDPWRQQTGWRLVGKSHYLSFFCHKNNVFSIEIETNLNQICVSENNYFSQKIEFTKIDYHPNTHQLFASTEDKTYQATVIDNHDGYSIFYQDHIYQLHAENLAKHGHINQEEQAALVSPMPGVVSQIFVNPDQQVKKSDPLVIIEAMKMEHTLIAPFDGKVDNLNITLGQQVQSGFELLTLMEDNSHEMA